MRLATLIFLTVGDVVRAHARAIVASGGSDGICDAGLLESAVMRAQTGYYNSVAELAAAYGHGLAKNHAFVDGNKRVAFLAADSFLRVNGFVLTLDPDKWEGIMLGVADGSVSAEALAAHFAEEMGGAVPLEV